MTEEHRDVLDLIRCSMGRRRKTFGHGFPAGYCSVRLDGVKYAGQRDADVRLAACRHEFVGKVVLDVGCNTGGMLHALSEEIGRGVGVDNQCRAVNAANRIADLNGSHNIRFYTFDVSREDWSLLPKFSPRDYDAVFMLSVALWIPRWRELVEWAHPRLLLYESHGKPGFQDEQEGCLRDAYGKVRMLADRSDDDARAGRVAKRRRLYLCEA